MEKTCSKCKKSLPLTPKYFTRGGVQTDGYSCYCKQCIKTYTKIWRLKNPSKVKDMDKKAYQKNSNKSKEKSKRWRLLNKERNNELQLISRNRLKEDTFNYYSGNNPVCICCGEQHFKFLTLDHIDAHKNGNHTDKPRSGFKLYRWLRSHNFPSGFQILCYNCNLAKGHYGVCPHKDINGSVVN